MQCESNTLKSCWVSLQEGIAQKGGLYGLGTSVMDLQAEDEGWYVHPSRGVRT